MAPNVFCTVLAFLPRSWRNAERALELPASVSIKIPSGKGGYSPLQRRAFTQNSHFIRRAVSCRRKIAVPVHAAGRIGPSQEHSFLGLQSLEACGPSPVIYTEPPKRHRQPTRHLVVYMVFTRFYPMTWTAFCATACSSSWIDGVGTVSRGIELSKFLTISRTCHEVLGLLCAQHDSRLKSPTIYVEKNWTIQPDQIRQIMTIELAWTCLECVKLANLT